MKKNLGQGETRAGKKDDRGLQWRSNRIKVGGYSITESRDVIDAYRKENNRSGLREKKKKTCQWFGGSPISLSEKWEDCCLFLHRICRLIFCSAVCQRTAGAKRSEWPNPILFPRFFLFLLSGLLRSFLLCVRTREIKGREESLPEKWAK